MLTDAQLTLLTNALQELFAGDASGHDIHHTLRVYRMATRIARAEGADIVRTQLGAMLHDADDEKLFPQNEPCQNARRLMAEIGIPADAQDAVCADIQSVSFKGADSVIPSSLEGKIVQDADRLDAIGAIGIARTFAYGGSRGRPMHTPDQAPKGNMTGEEYRKNQGSSVNHFYEKLLLLRDGMNTPAARAIAQARHAYMQAFLAEFYAEWDGER